MSIWEVCTELWKSDLIRVVTVTLIVAIAWTAVTERASDHDC